MFYINSAYYVQKMYYMSGQFITNPYKSFTWMFRPFWVGFPNPVRRVTPFVGSHHLRWTWRVGHNPRLRCHFHRVISWSRHKTPRGLIQHWGGDGWRAGTSMDLLLSQIIHVWLKLTYMNGLDIFLANGKYVGKCTKKHRSLGVTFSHP